MTLESNSPDEPPIKGVPLELSVWHAAHVSTTAGPEVREEGWRRFLAGWGPVASLLVIGLFVSFFAGGAPDESKGAEFSDLLAAAGSPVRWHIFSAFDALGWIGIGGVLLAIGALVRERSRVGGSLIALCGVAQLFGSLGGFARLSGVSRLGELYSNGHQETALDVYLALNGMIGAAFGVGALFASLGFLIASRYTGEIVGFPRWVSRAYMVMGICALLPHVIELAGGPFLFPLLVVYLLLFVVTGFATASSMRAATT